jgi:D-aspartate ligase
LALHFLDDRPGIAQPLSTATSLPPALLTMPTFGGTLATVRALGARGIPVTIAGSEFLAPARWSRYARRFVRCPSPANVDAFLPWLIAFGTREPGHFLYPASDDLAWLFAAHAEELSKHFVLFQPPVSTVVRLLDKKRLHAACAEVGLPTMPTWFPENVGDVEQLLPELPLPLVIKPRTQVHLSTGNHGRLIESRTDVVRRYLECRELDQYRPGLEKDFGDVSSPMLQAFSEEADEGVYSLAGFMHRNGQLLGARASLKVLQRPRRVGVGLCFEDAPVDLDLLERVVALCRRVGYHGVFETEFVNDAGAHRLIDFNPRFYGQMHFESARGLPLPVFAYLAAHGDEARLAALGEEARGHDTAGATYAFQFGHRFLLALRRLAGTSTQAESQRWKRWTEENRVRMTDASADKHDWLPGYVHATAELWNAARHARGYVRDSILAPE